MDGIADVYFSYFIVTFRLSVDTLRGSFRHLIELLSLPFSRLCNNERIFKCFVNRRYFLFFYWIYLGIRRKVREIRGKFCPSRLP